VSAFTFLHNIVLVLIAGGSIALAYDLQRKYPLKYLVDFFYYLIVIYFYWFMLLIVPDLLITILGDDFEARAEIITWLFVLFSFPCLLIGLYLFVCLFIHLQRENVPKWIKVAFGVTTVILGFGLSLSIKFSVDGSDQTIVSSFYMWLRGLALCVRLAAIVYAFLGALKSTDEKTKNLTKTLCIYYFAGFVFYSVVLDILPIPQNFWSQFNPFIYILLNVPPLFFLRNYAKKIFKDRLLSQENRVNYEEIFHKYGLSKREQEIFVLMLKGKSNKEIGEALFISVKTVKNHIYNIFQKLGVNSRIKLYVFIQNLANMEIR
jgi:DNA-binding CsgD family transcriptional regulator